MPETLLEYGRAGRALDSLPVIDIHGHYGAIAHCATLSLEEQVAMMDRVGINVAILSSISGLKSDVRAGNDALQAAISRYPGRLYGYIYLSANYPEFIEGELARFADDPAFVGIKVYQNGIPFTDPRFDPAWRGARERGLPVLAHTWGGNLTGFDTVAAQYPEVPFIAAHAGSDFNYRAYIDAAQHTPNLYLDLTYSREHTNMIPHFVAQLGAERLVWGSDIPLFSMAQQISKVLFAPIGEAEKRMILGENAMRVFGGRIRVRS